MEKGKREREERERTREKRIRNDLRRLMTSRLTKSPGEITIAGGRGTSPIFALTNDASRIFARHLIGIQRQRAIQQW